MNARYVIRSEAQLNENQNITHFQSSSKIQKKNVKRDKIDTPYTQIHVRTHSWHSTDTLFKKKK